MPRVLWKGSISFGLIHVPVNLYTAVKRSEIKFSMIDKRDHGPVGYVRINKSNGKEVPWDQIGKGFEYEKDQYVILGDEDFKQANVGATQTVEILDFVEADQINTIYFDTPYYLEPGTKGEKVYALLRETLKETGKVGIATVVLRTRQHLAALIPQGDMLILNLLRYDHELRDPEDYKVPDDSLKALGVNTKEIDMAKRLIEDMVVDWDPERYHDQYYDDIMALIDKKVEEGQLDELPDTKSKPGKRGEVIDLMALLKKSVEQTSKDRDKKTSSPKRKKTTAKRKKASSSSKGRKHA